jgi:hypothetical protein
MESPRQAKAAAIEPDIPCQIDKLDVEKQIDNATSC